jgi:hypothetical protein
MGTLTDELYRLVQGSDGLACMTWTRLHKFFLDLQSSRYLFLSKALRNTPHGDMSIATYASKLQGLADDLAAIGRPLNDHDLTLQFIDGLGAAYKLQAEILKSGPLPSFVDACSCLQLAEVDNTSQQHSAASQALVVHGGDHGHQSGDSSQATNNGGPHRIPGVSPNYKGKNPIPGCRHGGQEGSQTGGGPPTAPGGGGRGQGRGQPSGRGTSDHFGGRGGPSTGDFFGGHDSVPWYGFFAPAGTPFPPPVPCGHRPTPPGCSVPALVHLPAPTP